MVLVAAVVFPSGLRAGEKEWAVKIEGVVAFTEGPAWHPSRNVYFTDVVNNRIMRRDPSGAMQVYRTPSGKANGLVFDHEGRLVACEGAGEGGNRRVTRTEADGTITVLADRFEGKRLNSPNDVANDPRGRLYFSDPRYGDKGDVEQFDAEGRRIEGVYRIDPNGSITRVLTHEVDRPNGLAVSEDGRFLFVADNVNDGENGGVGGARKLWRFDLKPDGGVDAASRKLLHDWGTDRGPDGMTIGPDGWLYVTAGFNFPNPPAETAGEHRGGVYIFTQEGEAKGFIPILEDMVTNCVFGGPEGKTLFVTAGHTLWSVEVE